MNEPPHLPRTEKTGLEYSVDRYLVFLFATLFLALLFMVVVPGLLSGGFGREYLSAIPSFLMAMMLFASPVLLVLFLFGFVIGFPFLIFARPRLMRFGFGPRLSAALCAGLIAILSWVGLQLLLLFSTGDIWRGAGFMLVYGLPSAIIVGVLLYGR